MTDQVPAELSADRMRRLEEIGNELRRSYFEDLVGTEARVLVETPPGTTIPLANLLQHATNPAQAFGTSCRYAPVLFQHAAKNGLLHRVRIDRAIGSQCVVASMPPANDSSRNERAALTV
jgi:tRNA A37 methylthiotransferase MiaB